MCGSLNGNAPTIKKHLIAPQKIFQNTKKDCIKIHRGIKNSKDTQIIMQKDEYSMNKRRFGKPMRLKAVLEYCKLSEEEKKKYRTESTKPIEEA